MACSKAQDGGTPRPDHSQDCMYTEQRNWSKSISNPVKSLRREDNGNVIGLIAEGNNGEIYKVEAKSVIVCTGGFV